MDPYSMSHAHRWVTVLDAVHAVNKLSVAGGCNRVGWGVHRQPSETCDEHAQRKPGYKRAMHMHTLQCAVVRIAPV
jgi:hypothetical protein